MQRTEHLNLPIYNTPDVDIFDLQDWNEANEVLDGAYKDIVNFREELPKVNANAELIEARKGKAKLSDKITEIDNNLVSHSSSLEQKANINDVAKISSGTPLFASSTTGMTDTTKNYVNTTDGYLYVYSGGQWTKTGVKYQETGLSDNSVELNHLDDYLQYNLGELGFHIWNFKNKGIDSSTHEPNEIDTNLYRLISEKIFIKKGTVIDVDLNYRVNVLIYNTTNLSYEKESGFTNIYKLEEDKYIRLNIKKVNETVINSEDVKNKIKVYKYIDTIYTNPIYNFGNFPMNETTGEKESFKNDARVTSDLIKVVKGVKFDNLDTNYSFKVYIYDVNKNFEKIIQYTNSYICEKDGYIRLMYKKNDDSNITPSKIDSLISCTNILDNLSSRLNVLEEVRKITTNELTIISKLDDEKMTHGSCSVYDSVSGYVYTMYYYNPVSNEEHTGDLNITMRLARYNICNPQNVEYYHVAKNGDRIGEKQLTGNTAPYEPNLRIVGRYLYCFFNSGVDEKPMSINLRKFNLDTLIFDETLDILKINDNGVYKDLNTTNLSLIHNRLTGLSSVCTECRIISNFVGVGGNYYAYVNGIGTNGLFVKTTDFIKYDIVNVLPTNTLNDFMETDLEYMNGYMHFLFRHNNTGIYKIRYNLISNVWGSKGLIKVANEPSKPKIFYNTNDGCLYYIYNTDNRKTRVITRVNNNEQNEIVIQKQTSVTGVHYPSIFKNKNRIFETFSTSIRGFNDDRCEIAFHELDL